MKQIENKIITLSDQTRSLEEMTDPEKSQIYKGIKKSIKEKNKLLKAKEEKEAKDKEM